MIFALHYFLWFSALTPIYGYLSVYAKNYANVSPEAYGVLNMILPFTAILVKPIFCSLADRHRAYRSYFILFLVIATIGWGSFGILPFFIEKPNEDQGLIVSTWAIICLMTLVANLSMSVISCFSDAFAVNHARKQRTSYGRIRVWGTIGWGFCAVVISYVNDYKKLSFLVPGLLLTILFLLLDVATVSLWRDKSVFKLDKPIADIDNEEEESYECHPSQNSILEPSKTNKPNNQDGVEIKIVPSDTLISQQQSNNQIGQVINPDDLFTTGSTYGAIEDRAMKKATNSSSTDSSGVASNKVISLKLQLTMLKMVLKSRKSLIRYMILFTLSGMLISVQWSYFFLYLEKIYPKDFTYISGLSMIGQSMLGELPFFLLSQVIIDAIGRSHALSLSISSIGIRYLLYAYLLPNASMYFVMLSEAYQGPNFGLFYVVMTEVGNDYSQCDNVILELVSMGHINNNPDEIQATRRALKATMQGLVSACYEGLGLGIGSVLGGWIISNFGFDHLWIASASTALFIGLTNLMVDLKYKTRIESL